jgi:sialate O-acetylesterase
MLKTAMIFGNNMVLQRQKKIKVWGNTEPDRTVNGVLKGVKYHEASVEIEKDGSWMLTFEPLEAERGLELIIQDGVDTIRYQDISIGEVWIAGGQSNMEYFLEYDADKESVLTGEMNPDIRFFDYPEVSYEGQLEEHDYSRFGFWRTCTKEDLPYFSAPAYYFAENLSKVLNLPIGIVGCNWGGTPACAWMDPVYLKDNEGKAWLEAYENEIKDLDLEKYKAEFRANPAHDRSDPMSDLMSARLLQPGFSREEQLGYINMMMSTPENAKMMLPQMGPYFERRPGGLYETMLKKIAPYTTRGVIWYQGESDTERPQMYSTVFGKMIQCWRDLWKEELPFLFVQLAPFGEWLGIDGKDYPELRQQQEIVSKTVSNTWMISSSDVGMEWDIHPKKKKPIGKRLALLARGHIYGENLLCDPPELKEAKRVEGGIRIEFLHSEGLYRKGDQINALMVINTEDEIITPSKVSVVNNGLLLHGEFPINTVISFAKTPFYEVNLYNKADNPVKPFEVTI